MDAGDLFYFAMFVLWAFSQLVRLVQGKAATPTAERPLSLAEVAKSLLQGIDRAQLEMQTALDRLDPRSRLVLRSRLQPVLERVDQTRAVLETVPESAPESLSPELMAAIGESREIERALNRLHHGVQMIARARSLPGMQTRYRAADALIDSCWQEFEPFLVTAAIKVPFRPIALIDSTAHITELRNTPFAQDLAMAADISPLPWFEVTRAIGIHVLTSFPEAIEEIYQSIAPDSDAKVGGQADAMARVMLSSWLTLLLADAIGAQLLGPTYLHALSRLMSTPTTPHAAVRVQIGSDGVIQAVPPAHLRVHVVARWLRQMGEGSASSEAIRAWDDAHGSPRVLVLHGASNGTVDLASLLDVLLPMVDAIYRRPIAVFAGRRLAELPGLTRTNSNERQIRNIAAELTAGRGASADLRTLVAAATEAILAEPFARVAIYDALESSLDADVRVATPVAVGPKPPRGRASRQQSRALRGLDPTKLVDAMLLHDLVLARPMRSRGPAGKSTNGIESLKIPSSADFAPH